MNDTSFIHFKCNFTTFHFIYCSCYIIGNRTGFRIWHQVTGTKNFTQFTNLRHYRRCSNNYINICPATFNFLNKFVKTNKISTGFFCISFFIGSAKTSTLLVLPVP